MFSLCGLLLVDLSWILAVYAGCNLCCFYSSLLWVVFSSLSFVSGLFGFLFLVAYVVCNLAVRFVLILFCTKVFQLQVFHLAC